MYYIGTEQECLDYDAYVTSNKNYAYPTDNWANPKKHPTEEKWAIIANSAFTSSLQSVEVLDESWTPTETP